jgi:hypothetical protein
MKTYALASYHQVKLGLCQIAVGEDKAANIKHAREALNNAAQAGAKIICLPGKKPPPQTHTLGASTHAYD